MVCWFGKTCLKSIESTNEKIFTLLFKPKRALLFILGIGFDSWDFQFQPSADGQNRSTLCRNCTDHGRNRKLGSPSYRLWSTLLGQTPTIYLGKCIEYFPFWRPRLLRAFALFTSGGGDGTFSKTL